MTSWTPRRVLILTAAVLALTTAAAFAAIPSATGAIRGCYNTTTGQLRVVDERVSCNRSEAALTWNQTGPAGPTGPQGPAGSARAFGYVNADTTLDMTLSQGILGVEHPYDGYYCFKLSDGVALNAVANIDPTTVGYVAVIYTYVPHAGGVGLSGCPSGFNDAAVMVKDINGALRNVGFFVSFN